MHAKNFPIIGLTLLAGCASATGARGTTYREHQGSTVVVFTNATPQKMCELRMSFQDSPQMGDNWLPDEGLPSGQSVEFKVQPGTYQAMWSTCKEGELYYAGTLISDTAVNVSQQTQLYAYTADRVAPTKRAAVLTRDYKIVKFSGQPVGAIAQAEPVKVDLFAKQEAALSRGKSAPPKSDEPKLEKFSAAELVDPTEKRKSKTKTKAVSKPSLSRKDDVRITAK